MLATNHHKTEAGHRFFYIRPHYWTQNPQLTIDGNRETHEVAQQTSILCEHGPALLPPPLSVALLSLRSGTGAIGN
jgi:hypothetical protein